MQVFGVADRVFGVADRVFGVADQVFVVADQVLGVTSHWSIKASKIMLWVVIIMFFAY